MRDNTVRAHRVAWWWVEWLLYPLLFTLALVPRIMQMAAFVAKGELNWAFRSFQFWQGLALGNGHLQGLTSPAGTVGFWASALGLMLARSLGGTLPSSRWLALMGLSSLDLQNAEQVRLAAAYWPLAKLSAAALSALLIVVVAWLVARLWGMRAGILLSLILTIAPYHLALSHVLGDEAATAGLSLAALLALLWALRTPERWLGFLPAGALAGLALLNGPLAAPLLPYSLFLLAVGHFRRGLPWAQLACNAGLWCAAGLLMALLAWPVAYTEPVAAALSDLSRQVASGLAWNGHTLPALALALGLHMPPLTWVGLALTVVTLPFTESRQSRRAHLLAVWGLAPIQVLVATYRDVADPRPLLPALLALDTTAALGIAGAVALGARWLGRACKAAAPLAMATVPVAYSRLGAEKLATSWWELALRLALSAVAVAAIIWQGLAVFRYRPYYAAYCNPWLGAGGLQTSWGEGIDQAAHYLNAQPGADGSSVATLHLDSLAPFFIGNVVPLSPETVLSADYVVLYRTDWEQPGPVAQGLLDKEPTQRFRVFGVECARLYANRVHEPVLRVLDDAVLPDDVVIVDALTPLPQHFHGAASLSQIQVTDAVQAAADLERLATGRWRLWHVAFAGADPQRIVDGLLESQAVLAQRWTVPGAIISLYLLPLQLHFHALAPTEEMQLTLAASPVADSGQTLTLARVGVSSTQVQYRQRISVALQWQVQGRPTGNLALSLRLLDDQGRTWAQQDGWLSDAEGRSTAAWPGTGQVETLHTLAVPPGAPPGPYRLQGILYDVDTLQRMGEPFDLASLEILAAQLPPTAEEINPPNRLQVSLADGVEVLGYEIGAASLLPGQDLPVRIWWRVTHPVTAAYQAQLILLDAEGHERGTQTVELAGPEHPTPMWIAGEVIEGRYSLPVSPKAAAGKALLGVQLMTQRGAVGQAIRLGSVQVQAVERSFDVPEMQNKRQETIDQKVRLLGYDLTAARPGETAHLTLYWQCLAPMPGNYTVFVHLLDKQGQIRAAHDGIPVAGNRPTSGWVLHEVLADIHPLHLPQDLPPGEYVLEVGLYDAATGVRLPAYDGSDRRLLQDRIVLGKVVISKT